MGCGDRRARLRGRHAVWLGVALFGAVWASGLPAQEGSIVVDPVSGLVTTESGGTATFQVSLGLQPTANVTVALVSSDETEGTVSPASLTFTSDTWNVPQPATLTGVNDADVDDTVAYDVWTYVSASQDPNYWDFVGSGQGIVGPTVQAANRDNDVDPLNHRVLVVCVASGYTGDGYSIWQDLTNLGVRATWVNLTADGQVAALLAANLYEQIWVYDLSDGGDVYPTDWQAITDWYRGPLARPLICDGRIISSFWYGRWSGEGAALTANYYENLRTRGGGLVLGTDHDTFQAGINSLNEALGLNPFSGHFTYGSVPVDTANPLMTTPNALGTDIVADSSTGQAPYGLQPNGLLLYTVAWHGGERSWPAITSTIAGTAVLPEVAITQPTAEGTYVAGHWLTFEATATSGTAPCTYVWSSDAEGEIVRGAGTTQAGTLYTPGAQTISVQVTDAELRQATAQVAVTVSADTQPPVLQTTAPAAGAVDVPLATDLTLTFDEPVHPAAAGSLTLFRVTGRRAGEVVEAFTAGSERLTLDATGQIVTVDLAADLLPDNTYYVQLDAGFLLDFLGAECAGITDATTWRFSTVAPEIAVGGWSNVWYTSGDSAPTVFAGTDFGSVNDAGGTVTRTYTLTNAGTSPLALTGATPVTVSGAAAADFAVGQPASPVGAGTAAYFTVTFAPTAVGLRTATVSVASDDRDENPFTFAIQGTGVAPGGVKFTPLPSTSKPLTTTETGGRATVKVVLTSAPTADVTLPFASSDPGEGTVTPATLTFTPANWKKPQSVTVRGVDDAVADGNAPYWMRTGPLVSEDLTYTGVNPPDLFAVNKGNEAPAWAGQWVGTYVVADDAARDGGEAGWSILTITPTGTNGILVKLATGESFRGYVVGRDGATVEFAATLPLSGGRQRHLEGTMSATVLEATLDLDADGPVAVLDLGRPQGGAASLTGSYVAHVNEDRWGLNGDSFVAARLALVQITQGGSRVTVRDPALGRSWAGTCADGIFVVGSPKFGTLSGAPTSRSGWAAVHVQSATDGTRTVSLWEGQAVRTDLPALSETKTTSLAFVSAADSRAVTPSVTGTQGTLAATVRGTTFTARLTPATGSALNLRGTVWAYGDGDRAFVAKEKSLVLYGWYAEGLGVLDGTYEYPGRTPADGGTMLMAPPPPP